MTRDPALARLVKHALQREAQQNLSAGHHLMNGHWIPADALRRTRRKTRIAHLRQTVEALVFWAMTALIGLALMAIVVAIL
jgi:hypothetical protein